MSSRYKEFVSREGVALSRGFFRNASGQERGTAVPRKVMMSIRKHKRLVNQTNEAGAEIVSHDTKSDISSGPDS